VRPLLLAALLLGSVGCAASQPYTIANRHVRQGPIVCFGDSVTEGVGANAGHDYPTQLARLLREPVINAGIRGDTTDDGLRRLEDDVLSHQPRLVIVEFGGNDYLKGLPIRRAFRNLDAMVGRITARGAMVVIVGVAPGRLGDWTRRAYLRIARRHGAVFIPKTLDGILDNPALRSDRIHPNDAGYALLTSRVFTAVQPLMAPEELPRAIAVQPPPYPSAHRPLMATKPIEDQGRQAARRPTVEIIPD
jgi:lysophospholipase L1-like esterase